MIHSWNVILIFLLANSSVFICQFQEEKSDVYSDEVHHRHKSCTTFDGTKGFCSPLILCMNAFENLNDIESSACDGNGQEGEVCCPLTSNTKELKESKHQASAMYSYEQREDIELSSRGDYKQLEDVNFPAVSKDDIDLAVQRGFDAVEDVEALEKELFNLGLTVKPGTKEAFHQAFFGSSPELNSLRRDGIVNVQASLELVERFKLNDELGRKGLQHFNLRNTSASSTCPIEPPCPASRYRSIDGSCNNLRNPSWGKSFTPFQRLLPPRYADGVNSPRSASDGRPLPNPREISVRANPDMDFPNNLYTLILMQWAQFLDHDLTLNAISKGYGNQGLICCHPQILSNPRLRHPDCLPIPIFRNDSFYSQFNQTCMDFIRALPAARSRCTLGRLKIFRNNGADLLPKETTRSSECQIQEQSCFIAGDERVNEQLTLTVMHTLWMREHNRVADRLCKLNPRWNDEKLFQEARRIVGAELQHITYNEFLPIILGRRVLNTQNLLLKPFDYSYSYDPYVNPSIINAFAAAAYRYGHTLVQGRIHVLDRNDRVSDQIVLATTFFNPTQLYRRGYIAKLVRGLVGQPPQTFDRFVTDQLTNHLFQPLGSKFGLDLVAINTQRGRDHGIPGYNEWRKWCRLGKIKDFRDLENVMNEQSAKAYKELYSSVEDIDLFTAGISEYSVPGGVLGPTFACIVAEQFKRLKIADRFCVLPGTIIMTDGWRANGNLNELGGGIYEHCTEENFVDSKQWFNLQQEFGKLTDESKKEVSATIWNFRGSFCLS